VASQNISSFLNFLTLFFRIMVQTDLFNEHVKTYEDWYEKYPEIYKSEVAALKEQFLALPENIKGIEVGLGTGRFAKLLGIKEGVEPATEMARLASKRGIEVISGTAENLPYKDLQFDFALFVTICHLNNIQLALKQANRVLKHKGSIIIGFIDKDKEIGQTYEKKRYESTFFKNATFYTVAHITRLLNDAGFKNLVFSQTLFGSLDEINEVQLPKEGSGEGSFVIVRASKK